MKKTEQIVIEVQQVQKSEKERLDRLTTNVETMVKERTECNRAHQASMGQILTSLAGVVAVQKSNSDAIAAISHEHAIENESNQESLSEIAKTLATTVSVQESNSKAIESINKALKWGMSMVLMGVGAAVFRVIFK